MEAYACHNKTSKLHIIKDVIFNNKVESICGERFILGDSNGNKGTCKNCLRIRYRKVRK